MSELTEEQINDEFCKEIGIKKASCFLLNKDTNEVRYYTNLSGLYKKPQGWTNISKHKFNKPKYPDFIKNPFNFTLLLNVQWYMFGELGDIYKRNGEECFEANYLKTRLKAIKMCRSFGGGEMLDEYKKQLQNLPLDYEEDE